MIVRVLVTRPEPGITRTVALLRRRGHQPLAMPLTRTVALAGDHDLINGTRAGAYVVTSASAIHHWPMADSAPGQLTVPLYAVGEATAQLAWDSGFQNVRVGPGDADALAGMLIGDVETGNLLLSDALPAIYVTGKVRRPHIETLLHRQNLPLRTAEIYDTEIISYSTDYLQNHIAGEDCLAVLLYSHYAATLLMHLLSRSDSDNGLKNCIFLCLSSNVATAIPDRFGDQIRLAAAPNETDLLAQLDGLGSGT